LALWDAETGKRWAAPECRPGLVENIKFVNSWIHIGIWTVVILAVFGYLWWQGQIQRLAAYVEETREELRKCSWPSWDELKGSTLLIGLTVAFLGLFVYVIDTVLFHVFIR
jgi:preprotein translocase subunit SecE